MDERANRLIETIYRSATDKDAWQEVAGGLSECFGGAPTVVGVLLTADGPNVGRFAIGIPADAFTEFLRRMVEETTFTRGTLQELSERFGSHAENAGGAEIATLPLYTDWMKHYGLAPIWPVGHAVMDDGGQLIGGVIVFRKEGQTEFTERELGYADAFVPHLRRAMVLQRTLIEASGERVALGEAIDRLPTAVLLLDANRNVVFANRSARRVLDEDDGLRLDGSGLCITDARQNANLQQLIADALEYDEDSGAESRSFAVVPRPSGKRGYALMISPLLDPPAHGVSRDIRVVMMLDDPERGRAFSVEALETLYKLTHSEAVIVRMLAMGLSLEQTAHARGISMNTARSHLKHAFAKTGTARQSDLLRLILGGVAAIGHDAPASDL